MRNRVSAACLAVFTVIFLGSALPAKAAPGMYLGAGFGAVAPEFGGSHLDPISFDTGLNWELNGGLNFTKNLGLNMQLGQMFGAGSTSLYGDLTYSQIYLTSGLHLVYDSQDPSRNETSKFQPYVDLGLGVYGLTLNSPDASITETYDPAFGVRIALGMNMFLIEKTNLYIAPEISYHMVNYSASTWDDPLGSVYQTGLDANGNSLLLQVKIGYHMLMNGRETLAAR